MLQNHLKIALRNLWKNRIYSGINVFGLAVGLATCLLIALYVANELSYDRFNERADRIYRVVHHMQWEGGDLHMAVTSAPFAPALKQTYPAIEETVRIVPEGGGTLQYANTKLSVGDIVFADASLFRVFTHPFLYGDPQTALSKPQSIVLTRTLTSRLFGDPAKALGKTVLFENNFGNVVTGVIDDVPANAHLTFSGIRSMPTNFSGAWQESSLYTYLLLRDGTNPASLEAQFPAFFNKTLKAQLGDVTYKMDLQPLTSIHLHSNLDYEAGPNGNSQTVWVFACIAGLMLLLASINYMNLSTARSAIRIREVGIRRAIGSGRGQLVGLFLAETGLLAVIATGLGLFLAQTALPFFNELTGKPLSLGRFGLGYSALAMLGFLLLTTLLSGTYPALFMARARTVTALRGQLGEQGATLAFRKSLVTFQFVVTVALIAASGIIYQQLRFALTQPLGFNKEQVLTFHLNEEQTRRQLPAIKAQLLASSLIERVAAASNPVGTNDLGGGGYFFEIDGKMTEAARMTRTLKVDPDFLPTMEIKLAQGRNFSGQNVAADRQHAVLVNETLVKELGWQNPIGKRLKFFTNQGPAERQVVGVVKDFHTHSLQHKIEPLVLQLPPDANDEDNVYVRIRRGQTEAALALIRQVYQQAEPSGVFEYQFLDQRFARQYAAEQKQSQLLLTFTGLAILIACLGLFGLTTFMAEQRRKEIGVRKVLGASVSSIVTLLSKDFLKLVLIAIVIAAPLASWAMNQWLGTFAYKIQVEWWVFVAAGTLAVVIALMTVSFQSVKAALMNPVDSLRSE